MSTAVKKFVERLMIHYSDRKERDQAWVDSMIAELGGYGVDVLEEAASQIIRKRKERHFPLVAECIVACKEAQRWIDARKQKSLPEILPPDHQGLYSDGRRQLVATLLRENQLPKQAAREGWIGALRDFCFEHSRLPASPQEIAKCKAESREVDEWRGSDTTSDLVVQKARARILARREEWKRFVLKGAGQ